VALAPAIRLFGFRPIRPAFDNVIRDWIVPAICAQPGAVDVYVGRHGPDELGPRLVVSVWESNPAMVFAFGPSSAARRPEDLDGIADQTVEVLSPEIIHRVAHPVDSPRIIRVFRGLARAGQLDSYIEETRDGVVADVAAGHGPTAFYLARGTTADGFVAVSVWSGWSAIELATGGDVRQPMSTRRRELIATFEATHYEAIDL
jgi:hypothetical protein